MVSLRDQYDFEYGQDKEISKVMELVENFEENVSYVKEQSTYYYPSGGSDYGMVAEENKYNVGTPNDK